MQLVVCGDVSHSTVPGRAMPNGSTQEVTWSYSLVRSQLTGLLPSCRVTLIYIRMAHLESKLLDVLRVTCLFVCLSDIVGEGEEFMHITSWDIPLTSILS